METCLVKGIPGDIFSDGMPLRHARPDHGLFSRPKKTTARLPALEISRTGYFPNTARTQTGHDELKQVDRSYSVCLFDSKFDRVLAGTAIWAW